MRSLLFRMRAVLPAASLLVLFLWSGVRSTAATSIAEILNPPAGVTALNVALLTPLVYTVNGRALNTHQVNIKITKAGDLTPTIDTDVAVVAGAWQYAWTVPSAGGVFTIAVAPPAGGTGDSRSITLKTPVDPNPHESLDLLLNAGAVYANSTAITVQLRIAGGSTPVNTVTWGGDLTGVAATPIPTTHFNDNNDSSGLRYQGTAGGDGVKTATASVEFNWTPPETIVTSRRIILDMTKPTTTTLSATDSDFITQPDSGTAVVELTGTVTDTYGPRAVLIELFNSPGTPTGTPLTPATIVYGSTFGGTLDWTATVSVPNVTAGTHKFRVTAIDYAGNVYTDPTYYTIPQYSALALGKPFIVGKEGASDAPVPVYVTGTQTVRSQMTNPTKYKDVPKSGKLYIVSNSTTSDIADNVVVIAGISYLPRNNKNFNSLSAGEKTLYFYAKEKGTGTEVTSADLHVFVGPIGVSSLAINNVVTKSGVKYVAGTAALQATCSTSYFQNYIATINLRDDLNGTVTTTAITPTYSPDGLTLLYSWDTTTVDPGTHKVRITGTDVDGNIITQSNEYTVYIANANLSLGNITLTGDVSASTPPRVKDTITVKSRITEADGNDFLIPLVISSKQLLGTEAASAPEATLDHIGGVYYLTYNWDTTNATNGTTYTLQYKITDIFTGTDNSSSTAVIVDNTSTALTIPVADIAGLNATSGVYRNYPGDLNSIYVKGQIRIPGTCTNYDMLKNELISTGPDVYDRIISFLTDPTVGASTYTLNKIVATNTANVTVDWDTTLLTDGGGNPLLDGEYEAWLSATDINDITVPCNHVLLTVDNNPPVITMNDPSGALPQIKFDPPNGDNKLAVKAKIDDENPLDWTVDIAYYVTGDASLKHAIYTWSERSKDSLPGRTNSASISLKTAEASVGNVSVVWTIPDTWNTATNGTILVTAVDKAQNTAPPAPATPQVTFSFAVPGDTTVAPVAALAVHLPGGAGADARFVIVKNNGQTATYATIGNPLTPGMAASSGDPSDGFTRPNAFYPTTDYNNLLTKALAYQPLRVYTNNPFVVDAAARVSPKDTLTLMAQFPVFYSLTVTNRVYDFAQGKAIARNVAFLPRSIGDTQWDQSITQTLAAEEIGGVGCPTLYSLNDIASKDYYGSNQASLEVLVDTTHPDFRILSPSSLYCTASYTDADTTNTPMPAGQQFIVVPPGGTIPLVFKLNKNVADDDLRTPLKRMEVISGGTTVYKQMPAVKLSLQDGATGNTIIYNGANVIFNLVKAVESPNPYNGDGRALVTGNNTDQDGYTVAWNIPIDKKFAVGRIYRLRLTGMSDIVGNPAMTTITTGGLPRTVDAIDIYFKVSLRR